jgi:hypothetical protein
MCVLIKDLHRPVVHVCANKRLSGTLIEHFHLKRPLEKTPNCQNRHPPTPPHFAMYMQTKDLQRSVGDRYANKGLKGKPTSTFQHSAPAHGVIPSREGPAFAFRIWLYLSLRTLRLCVQRLYLRRFLLFFRSPKTAL